MNVVPVGCDHDEREITNSLIEQIEHSGRVTADSAFAVKCLHRPQHLSGLTLLRQRLGILTSRAPLAHDKYQTTVAADRLRSNYPRNLMPEATALAQYYRTLTDQELLNLKQGGGFTVEAEEVLARELTRRNLTPGELKRFVAVTQRNNLRKEVTERGGGYRSLGLQFFGERYLNEADRSADIRVRTKWFTISGIPLIPIASYRFKCKSHSGRWSSTSTQRRIIDRVSLDWVQVFMTWIKTAAFMVGAGLLIVVISWLLNGRSH